MKVRSLYLKNYIGIYNGLKEEEIFIDFSKSKNNITIIHGKNGSGKSTIIKALSPLPDDNTNFVPGKDASKIIEFEDGDCVYKIKYIHNAKNIEERETSKGYIVKNYNHMSQELNPSGNISSCKDILFELFNLDSNFVALSQLSSEDRGLADKRPAERKKFVNSIINNLEVYNNIYKTLSKRSSIFKANVNSLIVKLDNIGDIENVKSTLFKKISTLNKQETTKELIVSELARRRAIIESLDPNGNNVREVNDQLRIRSNIIISIKEIDSQIEAQFDNFNKDDIDGTIVKLEAKVSDIEKKNTELSHNKIKTIKDYEYKMFEKNEIYKDIESIKIKIDSIDKKDIKENLEEVISSKLENFNILEEKSLKILKNKKFKNKEFYVNLKNIQNIISNELNSIKNEYGPTIQKLMNSSDKSVEKSDDGKLELLIPEDINKLKSDIGKINESILRYYKYTQLKSTGSSGVDIYNIATKCEFNKNCPIKVFMDDNIKDEVLNLELLENSKKITEEKLQDTLDYYRFLQRLENIFKLIDANRSGFSLINKNYGNIEFKQMLYLTTNKNIEFKFYDLLNSIESEIDNLILDSNIIEEYEQEKSYLNTLNLEYNSQRYKIQYLKELDESLLKFKEKETVLNSQINSLAYTVRQIEDTLNNNNKISDKLIDGIKILKERVQAELNYKEVSDIIDILNKKFETVLTNVDAIHLLESDYKYQLELMKEEKLNIDELKHKVKLAEEYEIELADFRARYEKSETIKFYSSPTSGIQTIFMESYMNKIISMANQLLNMLFEGEYRLLPFSINETEFKIPCSGSGMVNDDISSMSTSQICMISMILSFALLFHSSTKYNILKLDEIDGGLDTNNRLQFLNLLYKQMAMLNCEQCIMISHNTEIDFENIDLVLLKADPNEFRNCNVIFSCG